MRVKLLQAYLVVFKITFLFFERILTEWNYDENAGYVVLYLRYLGNTVELRNYVLAWNKESYKCLLWWTSITCFSGFLSVYLIHDYYLLTAVVHV